MDRFTHSDFHRAEEADSPAAWLRPAAAVLIGTIGGGGMWSGVVALAAVQAEFVVARADAALPYTLSMLGYAFGGVAMGRLSDRYGIVRPMVFGTLVLSLGYVLAGAAAADLWQFALAYGVLLGAGSSVTTGPPSRWRWSPPRAISPARCGRRWCSISSRRRAGAQPTSASACSARRPCCRWCSCCAGG